MSAVESPFLIQSPPDCRNEDDRETFHHKTTFTKAIDELAALG